VPFGDPSAVRSQNRLAILKGFGLGCGGCGMLVAGFTVAIAAFIFFVFSTLSKSDGVDAAVRHATDSEQVRALLGYPIEKKGFVSGSVNVNNGTGSVDVIIPISGPKGKGSLRAVGKKGAGAPAWDFTTLRFTADGVSPSLDLLDDEAGAP
jgi:hypothetical protein